VRRRINYILSGGQPVPCDNVLQFASWFETHDKTLARTDITDGIYVSTVFLGIDHNFTGDGPPVLWETMIFGGPRHGYQDRYTSEKAAKRGHKRACAIARGEIPDDDDGN
jgi:hypothetical protein